MIGVGIVGCGRIVEEGHAPAFEKLSDRFRVVAVADASAERRDLIGDRFGVTAKNRFSGWDGLFACDDVELIDMALPHSLHRPSCVAAAATGKPILMEKPMATSMEDADAIMAAVQKSGVQACIVHNYLYFPHHARALELIHEGAIGRPFLFRSEGLSASHWPGTGAYDPAWRTKAGISGGGPLIDNAYHNLYGAAGFMGSLPVEVYAKLGRFVRDIEVEDTVSVTLTHANGGFSTILVGWSAGAAKRVQEVHGTEGSLLFDHEGHAIAIFRDGEWEFPEVGERRFGFEALFAEYADALEAGKPPPVPFSEGYRNLKVVMGAYESSRTGLPVKLA